MRGKALEPLVAFVAIFKDANEGSGLVMIRKR